MIELGRRQSQSGPARHGAPRASGQPLLRAALALTAAWTQALPAAELNLFDPLINQYVYTPISHIPPDWTGDLLLLFPLQQSLPGASWKTAYCPTNFLKTGRLGSWKELESLCLRSHNEHRGVGVDLILSHFCTGSERKPAPPFSAEDVAGEGHWGPLIDYSRPGALKKGCSIISSYVDRGVSLLRFDSANEIPAPYLKKLLLCSDHPGMLRILEAGHLRPEALSLLAEVDEPGLKAFDMGWLFDVLKAFQHDLKALQQAVPMPFDLVVLPLDNHDLLLRATGSRDADLDRFFERSGVDDLSMNFPLVRFFGLTAFNLPSLVSTTEHSLAENLAVESLRSDESLQVLRPILAVRKKLRHLPLHWVRNTLPSRVASYQRGAYYLFVCANHAHEQNCVVAHELRPGRYRELFSGELYDIDDKPIVFEDLTSSLYALEYQGEIPDRQFAIPPVVHMIWCQGWDQAPNLLGPKSFERCGLRVDGWDAARFEREILPLLPDKQQRAYKRIDTLVYENPRWKYMVQSDFMRLAILKHAGGYYADMDCLCHWPFQRHFQDYAFVAGRQADGRINNAFLGSIKGSPVAEQLLAAASERLLSLERSCPDVCWPAGPVLYSDRIRSQVGTLVLPFATGIGYDLDFHGRHCYVSHWYASLQGDSQPSSYTPGSYRATGTTETVPGGYINPYEGTCSAIETSGAHRYVQNDALAPVVPWNPWKGLTLPVEIDPTWLRIPGIERRE